MDIDVFSFPFCVNSVIVQQISDGHWSRQKLEITPNVIHWSEEIIIRLKFSE